MSKRVDEGVTVSVEGVSVEKELTTDEFPRPTVRFVLTNERNEATSVRICEDLPEEFPVDSVGFHPEYGGENWKCYEDHFAEFERELRPGQTLETLYGIRVDDDEATEFMTEPAVSAVPPGEDHPTIPEGNAAATGDGPDAGEEVDTDDMEADATADTESDGESTEGGDATSEDEPADAEGGTDEESVPKSEVTVETPPDSGASEVITGDGSGVVESQSVDGDVPPATVHAGPETGALVDRLVEELRRNDVDAEQKAVLREQLDLGVPTETKARIDRLQSRVETVAAYADSLEEFLDEKGTAQEVIRNFETQVEALREDVSDLRQHTRANDGDIASVDDGLADVEARVADLSDGLDDVAEDVESVEQSLESTNERVDDVEDGLEEFREWRSDLGEMFH